MTGPSIGRQRALPSRTLVTARVARFRRTMRRLRRPAAAVMLAAAAGLGVHAATPQPPPGAVVLVAAADVPAGRTLTSGDLTTVTLPPEAVPSGVLTERQALGRTLASPARRGEPLTDARVTGPSELAGAPPGTVAVPLPLPDAAPLGYVHAGSAVRLLAGPAGADGLHPSDGEPAGVLVERAVVLRTSAAPPGGLLAGPGVAGAGVGDPAVLLLAMSSADAVAVAGASGRRHIALALLP